MELAEGRREEALSAYRRGLEIRERIVNHFGETPESLRDLSVSLDRVGDVELVEGRREEALSAYRRSLEISERIVSHFGETPESLSDVVVSRFKMSQAETEQALQHLTAARVALVSLNKRGWTSAAQRPWLEVINNALEALNSENGN